MSTEKNLTDSRISSLKRKAQRYEVWQPNGHGFGVRVTPKGVKSFVLMYRFNSELKRLTLGNYPAMSLADANLAASNARKMLERGEDPGKAAQEDKQAERAAETVEQLCADYLERHAKPNKRSAGADERMINREILPHWRPRKAKSITRRDVVARIDAAVDRGSPVLANRLHSLLSKIFNFAVERGVLEHSPVHGVKKPHSEQPRERNLSAEEIAAAWAALDKSTMELNLRRATKLMLVTAQRRNEVLGLHEGEIDRQQKLWTIPGSRTKNGRPHVVPLSKTAMEIIGDTPTRDDKADKDAPLWIFPSPRTKTPYRGASLDHAVRDLFIPRERRKGKPLPTSPLANVERWTPHDLRRSVTTHMREIGISRDDVKLVLNHTDQSITGRVYDKYMGIPEKRRALDLWAQRLSDILSGKPERSNVVNFGAPENREAVNG